MCYFLLKIYELQCVRNDDLDVIYLLNSITVILETRLDDLFIW